MDHILAYANFLKEKRIKKLTEKRAFFETAPFDFKKAERRRGFSGAEEMTSAEAALKEKHFTFAAGGDLFLKGRIGFDFLKSDFS